MGLNHLLPHDVVLLLVVLHMRRTLGEKDKVVSPGTSQLVVELSSEPDSAVAQLEGDPVLKEALL